MELVRLLTLLLSAGLARSLPEKPKRSALNQLTRTLLRRYDCGVRPVLDWSSPTRVHIDFLLQSVLDVDSKTQTMTTSFWYRQVWTDEFLVWDPDRFDGINEMSLSSDAIWVPDIVVMESVDEGKAPPIPYIYVNSSGWVKNYRPVQVVLACSLDMLAFPFDKHNCSLTFRSWLHSVEEVQLALWRSTEAISNQQRHFMNDGEWELLSIPSHSWHAHQDHARYAHIRFNVLIRRRPLLYVVGLLIPSIFLMLVDVTSFSLPLNSRSRIAFKISILLGYTVFRVNLTPELPASALSTPLIGVFFAVCMAMLMLSLVKSIVVVKLLHHSEKEVRQMSVSACLLDKYGWAAAADSTDANSAHSGPDGLRQSADAYVDRSPEEDPLSPMEVRDPPLALEGLLRELLFLRQTFSQEHEESLAQGRWLRLCSKLDGFLFRLYLLVLAVYAATLLLLWASWSSTSGHAAPPQAAPHV